MLDQERDVAKQRGAEEAGRLVGSEKASHSRSSEIHVV